MVLYMDSNKQIMMADSHSNKKGIGCGRESGVTDLNSTALGLRTLRLHGYTVSSGIYNTFRFLITE